MISGPRGVLQLFTVLQIKLTEVNRCFDLISSLKKTDKEKL